MASTGQTSTIRNALWLALAGAASIANSVAVWMFLARWREPAEMGRFTIVMSLYMLFFTICSLGLGPFLVNEIARRISSDDDAGAAVFGSTATISLTLWGVITAVAMCAAGFIVSPHDETRLAVIVLSLAMIPTGAITATEAELLARGRSRVIAGVNVLENLLRTILPITLVFLDFGLISVATAFVAVRIVSIGCYFLARPRGHRLKFIFDRELFRLIRRQTPTFAGITILASLNWQIATILLARVGGEIESGLYGVASRIFIPVMILMSGYAGVIQPVLASKTKTELGHYLARVVGNLLLAATAISLLSPFLSEFVLRTMFGENFVASAPSLNILAFTVVPFAAVMVLGRGLVATDSQHVDLIANAIGVAVCFITGLVVIPRYGAVGAALAQFASLTAMAFVEIFFLSRKIPAFRVWRTSLFTISCLAVVSILVWK